MSLIPAIVQDAQTGQVLMLGFTNQEAMDLTEATGWIHFYSRSRQSLWLKGETSGNRLKLIQSQWDCDRDAILYQAVPSGPTCHTGNVSCFSESTKAYDYFKNFESYLKERISQSLEDPSRSYTQRLYNGTKGYLVRKLLEEAAEVSEAFVENQDNLKEEAADLLYHLFVLLIKADTPMTSIMATLDQRRK